MTNWGELYRTKGVYQSPVIDASSNFDYYISNITVDYVANDGSVIVEIRSSHDNGSSWGDWYNIYDGSKKEVFDGYGVRLSNTKFQFRVLLDMSGNVYGRSPVFNQISVILTGAYKIENTGDIDCLPEMWFIKTNSYGNVSVKNETTGQTISFSNLNNGETVYVDNENKDIKSDLPLKYRYADHNKQWFKLQNGENIITGTGRFTLEMRNEYKVLQG